MDAALMNGRRVLRGWPVLGVSLLLAIGAVATMRSGPMDPGRSARGERPRQTSSRLRLSRSPTPGHPAQAAEGSGAGTRDEKGRNATATCVTVATVTRYGNAGYDHIVVLTSACTKTAQCTVSTDVNPEPQTVQLAPRETIEVVTFRGSPARVFTARVSCRVAE